MKKFNLYDIHVQGVDVYARPIYQRSIGVDLNGKIWFGETRDPGAGGVYRFDIVSSINGGKTWELEANPKVYTPVVYGSCIAVGKEGVYTIRAEYEDPNWWTGTRHTYFRKLPGGSDEELTPQNGYSGRHFVMAVDDNEIVHLVAIRTIDSQRYQQVVYRNRTVDGTWSDETIIADNVDGGTTIILGEACFPAMCIDINGNIHVLYQEWDSVNENTNLKHVWRKGQTWQAVTDLGILKVYYTPSYTESFPVTADLNGDVHVAYEPGENDNIYYRKWNHGTESWEVAEVVDTLPYGGYYPNIAVDTANRIIILYCAWEDGYMAYTMAIKVNDTWIKSKIDRQLSDSDDYLQGWIIPSSLYPHRGNYRPSLQPANKLWGVAYRWNVSIQSWFNYAPAYLGNPNIDQLIYQHAERMTR